MLNTDPCKSDVAVQRLHINFVLLLRLLAGNIAACVLSYGGEC